MSDTDENPGGREGGPDHLKPSEFVVLARLCRIPFTDKDRTRVVKAVRKGLKSKPIRTQLAAVRAFATLEALNMEQEKRDSGGETLNVNLSGQVSVEARVIATVTKYGHVFGLIADASDGESGTAARDGNQQPVRSAGANAEAS